MPEVAKFKTCQNCSKRSPLGAVYCSSCGDKIIEAPKKTLKVKQEAPTRKLAATDPSSKLTAPSNRKVLSIVGGVSALAILFAVLIAYNDSLGGSETNRASTLSYESVKGEIEAIPIASATCQSAANLVENEPFHKFALENLEKSQKAADRLTIWNADKYLTKNSWIRSSSLPDDEAPYGKFVREVSDPVFRATLATINESFLDEVGSDVAENSFINFSLYLIESCGLKDEIEKNRELVRTFENANAQIVSLARQKPWYPKGFTEITNFPGFAYENISNQGCTYSFGSCAKFKIVSKVNCSSNLYVQTNLLSGGAVVDWSNDTAIVRAGQVAIMETSFSGSGGSWEFADISCY
jgi:hypothetical protein